MTNPKHAHASDNGRYYVHPTTAETWPSVTNAIDCGVNKPAFVPWSAKVTDEAWATNLPRAVRASRRPEQFTEFRKEMKSQVRFVKDTAADLGSRIHEWAEAHVLGKTQVDDDEVAPYGLQLLRWFEVMGVRLDRDIEAAEATIINRTHGYAGTGDLWVQLHIGPDGEWNSRKRWLALIDYKSSATRPVASVYPEYGMQLAALANAEKLLLDDGTEIDPPGPIVNTFVLNLRSAGYALIPMPADRDAAFAGFLGALATTTYLHAVAKDKPAPYTMPAAAEKKDVA
jgi:hypothetical protein